MSFNQEIQYWNNFKNIFYEKYFSNYIPPLFIELNNEKIAFVGFVGNKIGINLNPEFRGKKICISNYYESFIVHKK